MEELRREEQEELRMEEQEDNGEENSKKRCNEQASWISSTEVLRTDNAHCTHGPRWPGVSA